MTYHSCCVCKKDPSQLFKGFTTDCKICKNQCCVDCFEEDFHINICKPCYKENCIDTIIIWKETEDGHV